jgi:hypothetical protein
MITDHRAGDRLHSSNGLPPPNRSGSPGPSAGDAASHDPWLTMAHPARRNSRCSAGQLMFRSGGTGHFTTTVYPW